MASAFSKRLEFLLNFSLAAFKLTDWTVMHWASLWISVVKSSINSINLAISAFNFPLVVLYSF